MNLLELLLLILIAAVCGGIGQALAGGGRGGFLVSLAVGFIGALIGSWIARQLQLPEPFAIQVGTVVFPLVWSVIGGALFVALLGLLTRNRQPAT